MRLTSGTLAPSRATGVPRQRQDAPLLSEAGHAGRNDALAQGDGVAVPQHAQGEGTDRLEKRRSQEQTRKAGAAIGERLPPESDGRRQKRRGGRRAQCRPRRHSSVAQDDTAVLPTATPTEKQQPLQKEDTSPIPNRSVSDSVSDFDKAFSLAPLWHIKSCFRQLPCFFILDSIPVRSAGGCAGTCRRLVGGTSPRAVQRQRRRRLAIIEG